MNEAELRARVDGFPTWHYYARRVRPSRLAREFGYRVKMLRPRFTSWEGSASHRKGARRAFLCTKRTPLAGLDSEPIRSSPSRVAREGVLRAPLRAVRELRRRAGS